MNWLFIHQQLSRPLQVHHSLMDYSHMEIYVGEKLSPEEETPNLQIQFINDSHIMEEFIVSGVLG